uniref:Uncharacterized protein n=1 Tax=Siphoviridae sp. ctuy39 TaxID=2825719 RepID=A0A8S5VEH2_9CAUD|nr:MAG TPA: hypothetical protein [Siphoviridae sp. ctuy39]
MVGGFFGIFATLQMLLCYYVYSTFYIFPFLYIYIFSTLYDFSSNIVTLVREMAQPRAL